MNRKYYINGKETSFDIVLKYLEIMLECGTLNNLPITIKDVNYKE